MSLRVRRDSSIARSSPSRSSTRTATTPARVKLRLRYARKRGIQRNHRAKITRNEKASLRIDIEGGGDRCRGEG